MQNKGVGILLAAAAAYGIYRYTRMTKEEKGNLIEKGKRLLKEKFARSEKPVAQPAVASIK